MASREQPSDVITASRSYSPILSSLSRQNPDHFRVGCNCFGQRDVEMALAVPVIDAAQNFKGSNVNSTSRPLAHYWQLYHCLFFIDVASYEPHSGACQCHPQCRSIRLLSKNAATWKSFKGSVLKLYRQRRCTAYVSSYGRRVI